MQVVVKPASKHSPNSIEPTNLQAPGTAVYRNLSPSRNPVFTAAALSPPSTLSPPKSFARKISPKRGVEPNLGGDSHLKKTRSNSIVEGLSTGEDHSHATTRRASIFSFGRPGAADPVTGETLMKRAQELDTKKHYLDAVMTGVYSLMMAKNEEINKLYTSLMAIVFNLEKEKDCVQKMSKLVMTFSTQFKECTQALITRGLYYLSVEPDTSKAMTDFQKIIIECYSKPLLLDLYKNVVAVCHYCMAIALSSDSKPEDAISQLESAIKLCPGFAFSYYQRGIIISGKPFVKYEEAIKDFTTTISLVPDYYNALYRRGTILHYKFGKPLDAIEDYNTVIKADSRHFKALHDRAVIHKLHKRYMEALEDLKSSIGLNNDFHEASDTYDLLLDEVAAKQDSLSFFDKALSSHSTDYKLHLYKGVHCHNVLRKFHDALASYNKSIELNPNYYITYENRAALFLDAGDKEKALRDQHKAKALRQRRPMM